MLSSMVILKTDKLSVNYGNTFAVVDLSISIREKEIVTIIGSNGAGKTTTLKALAGLVSCRNGRVFFHDRDITRTQTRARIDLGICLVPEGRLVFPSMSVWNNLEMGFLRNPDRHHLKTITEHIFDLFPILAERRTQVAGTLSGGEQQMLAIARGMMREPKVLLLDEPTLGISPKLVEEIAKSVCRLRDDGMSILLVEQNASLALTISDRGYVMETGNLVLEGDCQELIHNDRVRSAYLAI